MVAVLKALLDDAMELIEIQQRMIRDGKVAVAFEEARERRLDEMRRSLAEEEEAKHGDAGSEQQRDAGDDKHMAASTLNEPHSGAQATAATHGPHGDLQQTLPTSTAASADNVPKGHRGVSLRCRAAYTAESSPQSCKTSQASPAIW